MFSLFSKHSLKALTQQRASQTVPRVFKYASFSTEEAAKPSDFPEPTEEDKEKYRNEWGVKYQDECMKFEKEWEAIAQT